MVSFHRPPTFWVNPSSTIAVFGSSHSSQGSNYWSLFYLRGSHCRVGSLNAANLESFCDYYRTRSCLSFPLANSHYHYSFHLFLLPKVLSRNWNSLPSDMTGISFGTDHSLRYNVEVSSERQLLLTGKRWANVGWPSDTFIRSIVFFAYWE